jgi:hypothetical protein
VRRGSLSIWRRGLLSSLRRSLRLVGAVMVLYRNKITPFEVVLGHRGAYRGLLRAIACY